MAQWSVELESGATEAALQRFTARLVDLRPFWPLVVPLFISWMRRQFESEGAFGGHPWPDLSPDYAERKAQEKPGAGLLVYEGDLRKAASSPRREATATTLTLGIDWASAKGEDVDPEWHQEGTSRMPARPLLFGDPLPMEAAAELDAVMGRYVDEAAALSGLRRIR